MAWNILPSLLYSVEKEKSFCCMKIIPLISFHISFLQIELSVLLLESHISAQLAKQLLSLL